MAGKTKSESGENAQADCTSAQREAIIDTALELAREGDWREVRLSDIAGRCGLTLAQLRGAFDSKAAIVEGLMRRIDREVLDGNDPEMDDEPPRDRLFDVLMRRFEALKPYRGALRSIARGLSERSGFRA